MSVTVILDASAAAAVVNKHSEAERFRELLLRDEQIVAPILFQAEIINAYTKAVRLKLISRNDAKRRVQKALSFVDEFHPVEEMTTEVIDASFRLYHSSYDMYYLVLAQRLCATVFTFDKRLASTCLKNDVDCICGMSISIDDENQDWLVRTHTIDGSTIVVDD